MVDKRPIGYIPGKGNPLDKKPPKNPKFQNIGPTLDTGLTVKNIEVVSNNSIVKKKNELFKRIKCSTVAHLIQKETNKESIYNLADQTENQTLGDDLSPSGMYVNQHNMLSPQQRSGSKDLDTQSVFSFYTSHTQKSAISKITALTYATEQLKLGEDAEFLLLDLREPDEYELFHIKEAINFPAPNITRDKFIPPLYNFKNKEGKLIIIYHFDERNGIPAAQAMYQKGYENVFLISGGIEGFLHEFPELIEGKKIPVLPKPEKKDQETPETSGVKVIPNHLEGPEAPKTTSTSNPQFGKRSQSLNKSKIGDVSKMSSGSLLSKITTSTKKK